MHARTFLCTSTSSQPSERMCNSRLTSYTLSFATAKRRSNTYRSAQACKLIACNSVRAQS
eukprot:6210089-Pleurochrysis_carterae.AAC.2